MEQEIYRNDKNEVIAVRLHRAAAFLDTDALVCG